MMMQRRHTTTTTMNIDHLDSFLSRDPIKDNDTASLRSGSTAAPTTVRSMSMRSFTQQGGSSAELYNHDHDLGSTREFLTAKYHNKVRDSFTHTLAKELRDKLEELDVQLGQLVVSSTDLVGREEEVEQLFKTFQSFTKETTPKSRLVSITGLSGTGKTVLARQLQPQVQKAGGYFCLGKFDSNANRAQPYTAFATASNELADQILALETSTRQDLQKRIQEAVGDQGMHLLLEVFPGLSRIVQPSDTIEVAHATIEQKTNQLQFMARQLVRVLSHHQKSPLVLVLDDVQWADPQSLNLVESLLLDKDTSFLLICTSRANEITDDHAFVQKLETFREADVPVEIIPIGNLSESAVQTVVANAMRESEDYTNGLAMTVFEKTHGNAFFVVQFLNMLVHEELLTYNVGLMKWIWQDGAIEALSVADNVGSLLAAKIEKLDPAAQTLLKVASCLGQSFQEATLLGALASLSEANLLSDEVESVNTVLTAISQCLDAGLLELSGSKYSFVHDQIQTSSFQLIPKEDLPKLQLEIGRGLLKQSQGNNNDDSILFLSVDLCNSGLELVTDEKLRIGLAFQNLKAAEKGLQKSCAFDAAIAYAKMGFQYLEPVVAEDDLIAYLKLRLNIVLAEASYCIGDCPSTEKYAETVIASDFPFSDKFAGYTMKMLAQFGQQQMDESAKTSMFMLKRLGYCKNVALYPNTLRLLMEIVKTKRLLKRYSQEQLLNLPLMTDENRLRGIVVVYRTISATFSNNPNLFLVLVLIATRWTVKYGVSKYSPPMISVYGLIVCGVLQDFEHGEMIGEVALALSERLHAVQTVAMTTSTVFSFIKHWKHDMRIARKYLQYGYLTGLQMGDNNNAIVDLICIDNNSLLSGYQNLKELEATMRKSVAKIRSLGNEYFAVEHATGWQFVLNMLGQADDVLKLTGDGMDEEQALKSATEQNHKMVFTMVAYWSGQLGYYYEDHKHAVLHLDRVKKEDCLGHVTMPRHLCMQALAHVALALEGVGARKHLKIARSIMKELKKWIDAGNPNIPHLVCLLEAEIAALKAPDTAQTMYETAIRVVTRCGYRHDKALAHARAARFFYVVKKDNIWGSYHIDKAIEAYGEWGAIGVARHLAHKYMVSRSMRFSQEIVMSGSTRDILKTLPASQEMFMSGSIRDGFKMPLPVTEEEIVFEEP